MSPDPGVSDSLDQLGVFVDQPGLPQHVGGSVLQLKDKQSQLERLARTLLCRIIIQLAIYLKQTNVK